MCQEVFGYASSREEISSDKKGIGRILSKDKMYYTKTLKLYMWLGLHC